MPPDAHDKQCVEAGCAATGSFDLLAGASEGAGTTIGEKERREDKCEDLVRLLCVVPRGWQEGAEEEKLPPPTICNGAVVRDSDDSNTRESELL
jgi:hypothetical protein